MKKNFIIEKVFEKRTSLNMLAIQSFINPDGNECMGMFINHMDRPIFYYFKNRKSKLAEFFYDTEQAQKAIKEEKVQLEDYEINLLNYLSFISLFEHYAKVFLKLELETSVFDTAQHQESLQKVKNLYDQAKKESQKLSPAAS